MMELYHIISIHIITKKVPHADLLFKMSKLYWSRDHWSHQHRPSAAVTGGFIRRAAREISGSQARTHSAPPWTGWRKWRSACNPLGPVVCRGFVSIVFPLTVPYNGSRHMPMTLEACIPKKILLHGDSAMVLLSKALWKAHIFYIHLYSWRLAIWGSLSSSMISSSWI